MEKNLEECRQEIDEIDHKIVELLSQRMLVAKDIAAYKIANQLPVYHAAREEALLAKIKLLAGEQYEDAVLAVYATILEESKKLQMKMMHENF